MVEEGSPFLTGVDCGRGAAADTGVSGRMVGEGGESVPGNAGIDCGDCTTVLGGMPLNKPNS